MRTVIAGFGNVLRGDDGFGVEVVRRLERAGVADDVRLIEVGTGGFHLAHELLSPCDRLVVVDAMTRGGPPGSVYVSEVLSVDLVPDADMHAVLPGQALAWAKALGVLPQRIVMVGCEPANVDELTLALSDPVSAAADLAVHRIRDLLFTGAAHE